MSEGRAERSVEDLVREAEEVVDGSLPASEFFASLEWALPSLSREGGDYAPQVVWLIGDASDGLAAGNSEPDPTAIRALAAAAAIAKRRGHEPESVAAAHRLLSTAGLLTGEPPEPRPRTVVRAAEASAAASPAPEPTTGSEAGDLARRLSPRGSTLAPFRVLGMGWAIVLSLVIGIFGGLWLDGQFGTSPWLTIVGLAFGLLTAGAMVRQLISDTGRR